jgi:hypothetical protein
VAGTSSKDVTSAAKAAKRRVRVVSLETPDSEGDAGKITVSLAETLADRRVHELPFEKARQNLDYPYILRAERVGDKARKLSSLLLEIRGKGCGNRIAQALKVRPGGCLSSSDNWHMPWSAAATSRHSAREGDAPLIPARPFPRSGRAGVPRKHHSQSRIHSFSHQHRPPDRCGRALVITEGQVARIGSILRKMARPSRPERSQRS